MHGPVGASTLAGPLDLSAHRTSGSGRPQLYANADPDALLRLTRETDDLMR